MAANREDRFLMRQRGAGTRQLRDSGFAIAIPGAASTPIRPQEIGRSRATPQSQVQSQPSGRTTPAVKLTYTKKTPASSRRGRSLSVAGEESHPPVAEEILEGSATKKRRLNLHRNEQYISIPRNQIAYGGPEKDSSEENQLAPVSEGDDDVDGVDENSVQQILKVAPAQKRKKRKSIGQKPGKKKKKKQTLSLDSAVSTEIGGADEAIYEDVVEEGTGDQLEASHQATPQASFSIPFGAETASGSKNKRKQKPIAQQPRKKRKSLAALDSDPDPGSGSPVQESQGTHTSSAKRGRPTNAALLTAQEADGSWAKEPNSKRSDRKGAMGTGNSDQTSSKKSRNSGTARATPEDTSRQILERIVPAKGRGRPRKSNVTVVTEDSSRQMLEQASASEVRLRKSDTAVPIEGSSRPVPEPTVSAKTRGRPRKSDVTASAEEPEDQENIRPTLKARKQKHAQSLLPSHSSSTAGKAPLGRSRKSDTGVATATQRPVTVKTKIIPVKERRVPKPSPGPAATDRESTSKPKSGEIPVTVHRLSRPKALNFIQGDEDDLAGPAPLLKRAGVNTIDVLAQICHEIVAKTVEILKNGVQREQGSKKSEWKRKRVAVEMFNTELESRMLQMTTALDHNYGLAMKLKQINKSKATYREDLLGLRRERNELALQIDAVRVRHEKVSDAARGAGDLSNLLHDIDLAVQRGLAAQKAAGDEEPCRIGLGMRIQEVALDVSSTSGRQGLLDRIKQYNAYLEAAVGLV